MLRSPRSSSVNSKRRTQRVVEAFLARRLGRQQLSKLMDQLSASNEVWEDSFASSTARNAPKSRSFDQATFLSDLDGLGLQERFEQLDDDSVWSGEERALYRVMAYLKAPQAPEESSRKPQHPEKFFEIANDRLEAWDRNGDFRLDDSEIDLVMAGGHFGESREVAEDLDSASVLVTLRRYRPLLESLDPMDGKGISQHDLRLLKKPVTPEHQKIHDLALSGYENYLVRGQVLGRPKSLSEESIEPFLLHQGVPGSCVLLASAAGLESSELKSIFHALPDGGYEIDLKDGAEVVQEPTRAERLYHAKGEDGERWPALLEIAMAQKLYLSPSGDYDSLRNAIDGIEPEQALRSLTGKETDKRSLDELSVNETRQALIELASRDGPKICGSRPTAKGDFISVEELHNGLVTGHCYTILDFDSRKDAVTLRNPWGHGEWKHQQSADDGIFSMPLRDFYSSFRWVAATTD